MADKDKDDNPIIEFGKIFVSSPKILKDSNGNVDFSELDIAPVDSLFDDVDNSESKSKTQK